MEDLIVVPSVTKRIFVRMFAVDSIDRVVSSYQIVNVTNKSIQDGKKSLLEKIFLKMSNPTHSLPVIPFATL